MRGIFLKITFFLGLFVGPFCDGATSHGLYPITKSDEGVVTLFATLKAGGVNTRAGDEVQEESQATFDRRYVNIHPKVDGSFSEDLGNAVESGYQLFSLKESESAPLLGLAGFAVQGSVLWCDTFVIDPEHQSKGLGGTLLNLLADKARELGLERVGLATSCAYEEERDEMAVTNTAADMDPKYGRTPAHLFYTSRIGDSSHVELSFDGFGEALGNLKGTDDAYDVKDLTSTAHELYTGGKVTRFVLDDAGDMINPDRMRATLINILQDHSEDVEVTFQLRRGESQRPWYNALLSPVADLRAAGWGENPGTGDAVWYKAVTSPG